VLLHLVTTIGFAASAIMLSLPVPQMVFLPVCAWAAIEIAERREAAKQTATKEGAKC
jgi:hypothetical protein